MGRTPKPLTLLVHPSLMKTAEVVELAAKGHTIEAGDSPEFSLDDYDIVLSPNAWKMDARLIKYLDLAVKAARTIKYPKEKKK